MNYPIEAQNRGDESENDSEDEEEEEDDEEGDDDGDDEVQEEDEVPYNDGNNAPLVKTWKQQVAKKEKATIVLLKHLEDKA